ncbi:GNAT family N-acetyltransferase [Vagococcus elongatus]|uniref:GNAT family N-acetyltransferase n=1 Tax=Vagococcus elongatus TaxID=180344 RepID=A0A430B4J0_9ENTE|nr:GNAT family N-acetyltransferase [Vagococcus elongatus]RSU15223.1 GNAT family N-acetyltransferase [Vagococcus elongatus]
MKILEETRRFQLLDDNDVEIGEVTFSIAGDNLLILDHTFVEDAYRGQGLAEQLVAKVADKARNEGKKIIPLCPFARKEFETKTEYADVWRK